MKTSDVFRRFAAKVSRRVGSSWAFALAVALVVLWVLGGLSWGFTDSWLLTINTVCSVTTFLIVFLIQNSQNRSSRAQQLKLDELLKAISSARTDMVGLEELTDHELDEVQEDYRKLREEFITRQQQLVKARVARRQHKK